MKRNLATIDRYIGQDWSRLIQEAFADGLENDFITEGGKTTTGIDQGIMAVSSAKNFELGTRRAHDSKVYRYAKCDTGTAIIAGDLIQSAALGSGSTKGEQDLTIGTGSTAGDNFGYATLKTTGATVENEFKDGYYVVSDGSAAQGCGQMKKILSHPATTGAVTCKFTFTDTLEVLISTSGKAGIIKNLYDDVIQAPATMSGVTVGVAPAAVPVATPYFWLQTWGLSPMLIKTALTAGVTVMRDSSTGGSGGIASSGTTPNEKVGRAGWVTDTGDNGFVVLTLAP